MPSVVSLRPVTHMSQAYGSFVEFIEPDIVPEVWLFLYANGVAYQSPGLVALRATLGRDVRNGFYSNGVTSFFELYDSASAL